MAKKIKKVKEKKPEQSIEMTVLEQAKQEKKVSETTTAKSKQGAGLTSRPIAKQVFKIWCLLPDIFKGAPDRITEMLGYQDQTTLELLKIKNMQAFATEFGLNPPTLSKWRGEIENDDSYIDEVKKAFKPLTKNVMASLYRKVLEEGDGPRVVAYMKIIEGWREQLGIEHTGTIGDGLTPEERKALDELLAKNTQ